VEKSYLWKKNAYEFIHPIVNKITIHSLWKFLLYNIFGFGYLFYCSLFMKLTPNTLYFHNLILSYPLNYIILNFSKCSLSNPRPSLHIYCHFNVFFVINRPFHLRSQHIFSNFNQQWLCVCVFAIPITTCH
jgi:hypothetical protein